MGRAVLLYLSLVLVACDTLDTPLAMAEVPDGPRSQAPEGFWGRWGDGQAELAGYALTQSRYGELRHGEAVLVTVTEDFLPEQRVKSDGGHGNEFPVLKLNEIRDFQTGIYDYNVLTSTFLPLGSQTPRGVPTKLSMSMQEWCGHVYDQLLFDAGPAGLSARRDSHSYFDGEADSVDTLSLPDHTVAADALPVLVRGLTGSLVALGDSIEVRLLPRLSDVRMQHRALKPVPATVSRDAEHHKLSVPAGTFDVESWTVRTEGLTTTYQVSRAEPHELVGWSRSDGEHAVLTGILRRAYWREHNEGQEHLRAELGLPQHIWPGAAAE